MSPLLKEILEYLHELEDRQMEYATRDDFDHIARRTYRERAWVVREAYDELVKRYAPRGWQDDIGRS